VSKHAISGICTGHTWSDITHRKIGDIDTRRLGRKNARARTISNCRGEVFDTVTEAALRYDIDYPTLIRSLNGKYSYAGKYSDTESKIRWKYDNKEAMNG